MGLKFSKVRNVKSPHRVGKKEAGIEFYVPKDYQGITMFHGDSVLIPLGVKVKLPEVPECLRDTHEYMLELKNKSGVGYKKGLVVGSCVIDTTYQGEVFLNLHNNTEVVTKPDGSVVNNNSIVISPNDNIVQGVLILVNIEEPEEVKEDNLYLEETDRGSQGFGSNYREKEVLTVN
jgi:dUTPase